VSKVLVFIPEDKALNNLLRYNVLKKFQKKKYIILTTSQVAKSYPSLTNVITFNTSWNTGSILHLVDYFYLKNFFQKNNKSQKMYLRTRVFGPYKINSTINLLRAVKSFFYFLFNIRWIVILKLYQKPPEIVLEKLREKNLIASNDTKKFMDILKNNRIASVISITTLKHPILFDFSEACSKLNIPNYVFPDCWDNISNSPAIPSKITRLCVWSKQQQIQVGDFHPNLRKKTDIFGTYRTINNVNNKLPLLKSVIFGNNGVLKILYIEGYFYEDLQFVIQRIVDSLLSSERTYFKKILITIRHYPRPRQNENSIYRPLETKLVQPKNLVKISIEPSSNYLLADDLNETNLVFSELSTAALEAATRFIPVIFISSNRSPRYLDTRRGYLFPFAYDLQLYFDVIDLSSSKSVKFLSEAIERNLNSKSLAKSKLDFLAPSLNLMKLNKLHGEIKSTLGNR
jgi:hypothetical protein